MFAFGVNWFRPLIVGVPIFIGFAIGAGTICATITSMFPGLLCHRLFESPRYIAGYPLYIQPTCWFGQPGSASCRCLPFFVGHWRTSNCIDSAEGFFSAISGSILASIVTIEGSSPMMVARL
jgi:hypothetical protein